MHAGLSHVSAERAGAAMPADAAGLSPPRARSGINQSMRAARVRRGRVTFTASEQLTAEPRKHESRPSHRPRPTLTRSAHADEKIPLRTNILHTYLNHVCGNKALELICRFKEDE